MAAYDHDLRRINLILERHAVRAQFVKHVYIITAIRLGLMHGILMTLLVLSKLEIILPDIYWNFLMAAAITLVCTFTMATLSKYIQVSITTNHIIGNFYVYKFIFPDRFYQPRRSDTILA